MFRRNLIVVWMGITFLSGMFLMGQDTWQPPACVDNDGDGYGDPASASCTYPQRDCIDRDATVYPGAPELCDAIDNQCAGDAGYLEVDEGYIGDDGYPLCGVMVSIPAGCFDMGDAFGEGNSDELPVHNVCISDFKMDHHEVTNEEYAECVDHGGCTPPYDSSSWTRASYYGNHVYRDFPVVWVDWYQAEDYCTWAGERLPTEAEWEYAARGGLQGKRYPWGDTISGEDANYWDSGDPDDNDTTETRWYEPNGYGLYDMAGNVWEWVNDWYQSDYYTVSPPNDPPGPVSGALRVVRGGTWFNYTNYLRVATRGYSNSDLANYPDLGFRCAR